jgi:serine/threonine protein kinase/tetratricopeptide (TPR) repeat protein
MALSRPGERAVFDAARGIEEADARRVYLEQACGDDRDLRARIEALLRIHDQESTFLGFPAEEVRGRFAGPVREAPGAVIGPYRLLRQIGEGGMGVVFLAEQERPVRRRVALKIIRAGMGSAQVIARLEAERQALALMDHPNIAKFLDAGATEAGCPYFVMELVEGVPITAFCDEHRLTPRQRLGLFVPVCQAVQHAHAKGVIHRDLKPSNVLVALYDGVPVPKVIDFGVAKATGQKLTGRTLDTGLGAVVGTLEYMSPEQAEPKQLDIDTRSDVYALGVLLYELLTGTTPLGPERLQGAGPLELLRVIREGEPPPPSRRLGAAEDLPAIAASRGLEPMKLVGLVRGELDWIVLRCLEKDCTRRYETASTLALDVQRYLADEPVSACPPSAGYRLKKFVRRNKGPVLAASLVVLALVGGIVGTAVGLVQAVQARKDAVAAKEAEAEQRRTADEERAVAQAVSDFLQQDLLRQADSREQADRGPSAEPNLTVKEALHRAAARIGDRFQDQPLVEAAIRQAIGEAYIGIGEDQLSVPHLERSLALRKARLGTDHLLTLSTMSSLAGAYAHANRLKDALFLDEETFQLRKAKLGPTHPDTLESMEALATTYRYVGRLPDAVSLHEETLKLVKAILGPDHAVKLRCMINLGLDYQLTGRASDAVALHEEALKLSQAKRGPHHPGTLLVMTVLGMSYEAAGRSAQAISLHEETLKLMKVKRGPDHPHTLATVWGLAQAYRAAGRLAEAVALQEDSLKRLLAKRGPRDSETLRNMTRLASLHTDMGRHDLAEPLLRQFLTIIEAEWSDEWDAHEVRSRLGGALLAQKKYAEAEPLLVRGYEGLKKHEADIPSYLKGCPTEALERLVQLYDAWKKPDEAARWRKELKARKPGQNG